MRDSLKRPLLSVLLCGLPALAQGAPALPYRGFNPSWMNRDVKPCVDFYEYALGGWLKTAEIPKEYPFASVDVDVNERIQAQVRALLEEAAADVKAVGPKARVGAFYAAAMDEAAVERAGANPLKPLLAKVEALKDAAGLPALLAELHRQGMGGGFGFYIAQDERFSSQVVPQFSQSGLGLPERDYYLKTDGESKALRAKYEAHIAQMLALAGARPEDAKAEAQAVLALETKLARASKGIVELRDPIANYHRMTLPELQKSAPGLAWAAYFEGVGLGKPGSPYAAPIVVHQPGFLKAFDRLAHEVSLADWKAYLRWNVVRSSAGQLSNAFVEASFAFYGKTLSGTEALRPRWKRMFGQVDAFLGEDLGQLYVAKHFPPAAKAKVFEMVMNLKAVLRERIKALPWMEEGTKKEALRKLEAFQVKVGYPDTFRDYATLEVRRDDFFGNVLRASEWEFRRNLAKVGRPVDRGEWGMTPQTNNAYYNPSLNEICFPAGILQFPYFDLAMDDATNYGNIGATIGHEMTHGFDDQGRLYDADGNLKEWWTKADSAAYNGRAEMVAKQFDAFEPLPGLRVNGKQTLGENIADLGGLLLAWDAWRMTLKGRPEPAPLEGFTAKQRFFLGYAETWRMKPRPEYLKLLVSTDVHSPAKYRVLGPLSNLPEFFEAFGCQDGEPMKRDAKARPSIW